LIGEEEILSLHEVHEAFHYEILGLLVPKISTKDFWYQVKVVN